MQKIYPIQIIISLIICFSAHLAFAIDEIEAGDTYVDAQSINLTTPQKIKGNIGSDGDVDYFSFTAQAGNKISAAVMTNAATSINTDTELRLIGPDGTTVIEFDDNNGVVSSLSSSLASVNIPTTGTYYLQLKNKTTDVQIRPYYLYVVLQTVSPTAENPALSINSLTTSNYATGSLSDLADQDFYSISVNEGDTIFASLDLDPDRNGTNFEGQMIFIYPDAGDNDLVPAFNDPGDGNSSADSEAGFMTAKVSGQLLVGVAVANAGTTFGNYRLQVAVFPEEAPLDCVTYSSGQLDTSLPASAGLSTSTLNIANLSKIGKLSVNLNLSHESFADLDLSLVSPSGNEVILFSDISTSEALMDLVLKEESAIPIGSSNVIKGVMYQPEGGENGGRLSWFNGVTANGDWVLKIRDDQNGSGGTLHSWGLTICEPIPLEECGTGKVQAEIFATDFEEGNASFTHSGTQDEWQYGLPIFSPITSCYSGSNCWKTDLDGGYNASSSQLLVSPVIDLGDFLPPYSVRWAHRYNMEDAKFDQYYVEAESLSNSIRLFEHLDADMVASVGNPTTSIDQSAGWGLVEKDISDLGATEINLKFHVTSDSSVEYTGVAVDDVTVLGCLLDQDNDGTADIQDDCPNDPAKSVVGICGCGVADTDSDSDGTANCLETCDNDPSKIAPGVCGCGTADTDTDFDGTLDCNETCDSDPLKLAPGVCGCGTADTDSDSDGIPNCNDACASDPLKTSEGACGCGVIDTDTDVDGTADCIDSCISDPLKIVPGECGCGTADIDSDQDGTASCNDSCDADANKVSPGICGCGTSDADSDGDSTLDCQEVCTLDPLKTVPGICGCGVADSSQDVDSDGTPDCIDSCVNDPLKTNPGSCGCGELETDSDSDGSPDCIDLCQQDPLKVSLGVCGCGVADTDTDVDGTPNCIDDCASDSGKITPGTCGCGVIDQDLNENEITDCLVNPELKAQLNKLLKSLKKVKINVANKKKVKKVKKLVLAELKLSIDYANQQASKLTLKDGADLTKLVKIMSKKVKRVLKLLPSFTLDKKQANKSIKTLSNNILD